MGYASSNSSTKTTTQNTQQTTSGNSSPQYNSTGDIKVDNSVDVSPQVTNQAFDAIKTLVSQALDSTGKAATTATDTLKTSASNVDSLVSAVLAKDQSAAANTASGGQTETSNLLKWLAGAAVAGSGLVFFFRRK
jgi:hypothetical protein